MEKFKTVKKIIDGVEYTAQFNGLSAALEAVDNSYRRLKQYFFFENGEVYS